MPKHLINAFAVITAGFLGLSAFILPSQARSQETTQSCEIALSNAKNRIEQERDITVEIDIKDSSEEYPDHPDGRPTIIWFEVEGNAAESVMESPVFQRAIASEIIKSCNYVGAVTFGRKWTGWISTVGLMRDGSIQNFECLEHDPRLGSPSWGQEWCSI
jgi:hypothetical protein